MVILRRLTLEMLHFATSRSLDTSHLFIIQEMVVNVYSYIYIAQKIQQIK